MVEALSTDKAKELLKPDSTKEDKAKEEEEDAKWEEDKDNNNNKDNDDDNNDNDKTKEVVIQLNSTKADQHDGWREEIVLKLDQQHLLGSSSHTTIYRALHHFLVETKVAVKMWDLLVESKKWEKVGNDLKWEVDSIQKLGGDVCVNFITYHKDKRLGLGKALKDPRLWWHHLWSIVHQLLVVYNKCHQANICHQDIKPENILISKDSHQDSSPLVKLCDFAFSQYFKMGQSSTMTTKVGTVDKVHQRCWMAPEVDFDTGGCYKKNSDLWLLGCVIHFVATKGEVLFCTLCECDDTSCRMEYLHWANMHVTHLLLFDLIDSMTQADPGDWITVERALAHLATWSSECIGTFLCDLANTFNQGKAKSFQHTIDAEARLIVPNGNWMAKLLCLWANQIDVEVAKRAKDNSKPMRPLITKEDKAKPTQLICWLCNLKQHSRDLHPTLHRNENNLFAETVKQCFPPLLPLLFHIGHLHGSFMWSERDGHTFTLT